MINFKKYVSNCDSEKTNISPIEVYNGLDRTSETGPLRESQEWILEHWYKERFDDKDLIVKMNTGEGKTLVGLLILLTKLKHNKGKHIYLCPNSYLVEQVCKNADRFGIPYCKIENNGEIPIEFLTGGKILITNIYKVFNGKSKFGIGGKSMTLDTVLIDDAHSCVEIIKKQHTIIINRDDNQELYNNIINVFKDDLEKQAMGTYNDILDCKSDDVMLVPYWAFIDNNEMIFNMIRDSINESNVFAWELVKNEFKYCQLYISSKAIEICPDYIDITKFGSFSDARNRILMSASEQDQTFLLETFQFSDDAIKNPLLYDANKYTGEKMILFPSLLSDTFDKNTIATKYSVNSDNKYGIVALVSSSKRANYYSDLGSKVVNKDNIDNEISKLKQKQFDRLLVIVNRYDGIDLPDESCRVLIFDSLPYSGSLSEQYEDKCRKDSFIVNKRIAQKIEQGIGRGVRGEKDYCVILITGNDIVSFIFKNKDSLFSNQIRKQFEIGNQLMNLLKNDAQPPQFSDITNLISQMIKRDEGWKEFYKNEMCKIENDRELLNFDMIKHENEFLKAMYREDFEIASKIIYLLAEESKKNEYEHGWYLQQMARCKYYSSKDEAMELQKEAYQNNIYLLRPNDKIDVKKVEINSNQIESINNEISKYSNYNSLYSDIKNILDDLSFGVEYEKFEEALCRIGKLLGFASIRPDKLYGEGPDNLWGVGSNRYFLFECKSEVSMSRDKIKKDEVGQCYNHIAWFKEHYRGCDFEVYMVIPTNKLGKGGYLDNKISIIKPCKLEKLKKNIKEFVLEFNNCDLKCSLHDKIKQDIVKYELSVDRFKENYSEYSVND